MQRDEDEVRVFKAIVHVTGCATPFRISCGAGHQTVRWLAGVVAQRYALTSKSKGRMRHREAVIGKPGRLKPMVVSTMAGDVLHPSSKLKDVFSFVENELCVSLQHNVVLDNLGSMRRTAWASDAFVISDRGRERVLKKRTELAEQVAEAKAEEEAEREAKLAREYCESVNAVLRVDVEDSDAVAEALEHSWPEIRVDRIVRDPRQVKLVKRVMLQHFVIASDLFKHYCGSVGTGDIATMCRVEFEHLCLNTGILHLTRDSMALDRIMKNVNAQRSADEGNSTTIITRFEFFEALLHVAIHNFCQQPRPLKPAHALQKLFRVHLEPAARRLTGGIVRAAMATKAMGQVLKKCTPVLRMIFDAYKGRGSGEGADPFAMGMDEFALFLREAGMMDDLDGDGEADMSMDAARTIFSSVQLNTEDLARTPSGKLVDPSNTASDMTLVEFVEAVARLAVDRFLDSGWDIPRKFNELVRLIAQRLQIGTPKLPRGDSSSGGHKFSGGLSRPSSSSGGGRPQASPPHRPPSASPLFGGAASGSGTGMKRFGPPKGSARPVTPAGASIPMSWD